MRVDGLNIRGVKLGTSDVNLYIGDRILYQELEYIEATGQQFIATTDVYGPWDANTNYGYWDINSIYRIEIKANVQNNDLTALAALLSINDDYGPTIYWNTTGINHSNPGVYWKFPSSATNYFDNISPTISSERLVKLFDFDTAGEATVEYQCKAANASYFPYGIMLFGRAKANINNTDRRIKAKLYYCRIYKDDVLLLDFIPVKTFKGEIGLFDKVNGKFIASYEGTPFTAGPEI